MPFGQETRRRHPTDCENKFLRWVREISGPPSGLRPTGLYSPDLIFQKNVSAYECNQSHHIKSLWIALICPIKTSCLYSWCRLVRKPDGDTPRTVKISFSDEYEKSPGPRLVSDQRGCIAPTLFFRKMCQHMNAISRIKIRSLWIALICAIKTSCLYRLCRWSGDQTAALRELWRLALQRDLRKFCPMTSK